MEALHALVGKGRGVLLTALRDRLPAEKIDKLAVTVRGILEELARDDGAP